MKQRYSTIFLEKTAEGKTYRRDTHYPEISVEEEDIYLITTLGDRYDILAKSFYGDPKLWWIIAVANNSTKDSMFIEPGIQIRIPSDKGKVLNDFENFNRNR